MIMIFRPWCHGLCYEEQQKEARIAALYNHRMP